MTIADGGATSGTASSTLCQHEAVLMDPTRARHESRGDADLFALPPPLDDGGGQLGTWRTGKATKAGPSVPSFKPLRHVGGVLDRLAVNQQAFGVHAGPVDPPPDGATPSRMRSSASGSRRRCREPHAERLHSHTSRDLRGDQLYVCAPTRASLSSFPGLGIYDGFRHPSWSSSRSSPPGREVGFLVSAGDRGSRLRRASSTLQSMSALRARIIALAAAARRRSICGR